MKNKDEVKWRCIQSDLVGSEGQARLTMDKKRAKQEGAERKSCPVRALWPSWCWAGLLFLATDSKQGNFACSDVALDEVYM